MEKFDGIRGVWNGSNAFVTRSAVLIKPPPSLLHLLPKGTSLDGELWSGRGNFEQCARILRANGDEAAWSGINYIVFDAPHAGGPFTERLRSAELAIAASTGGAGCQTRLSVTHIEPCGDQATVKRLLCEVEAKGGEGLMLRKGSSLFRAGRSRDLLKVKSWHDGEAQVLGNTAGKSSLICKAIPTGCQFGLTWNRAGVPPGAGSIVTYRYQALTGAGLPRFPILGYVHPNKCVCETCSEVRK